MTITHWGGVVVLALLAFYLWAQFWHARGFRAGLEWAKGETDRALQRARSFNRIGGRDV